MRESQITAASFIEYPIFRVGIKDWFKKIKDIEYSGNTGRESLQDYIEEVRPHIFFLYTYDSRTSLEILSRELKEYMNRIQVAVFIDSANPEMIRRYIISGVRGIILNSVERTEFIYATKVLSQKGMFVSKEISSLVYDTVVIHPDENIRKKTGKYKLTSRETEIMFLLYKEMNKHDIAKSLNISPRTVDAHKNNIFKKLGIRNNVGLAKFIIINGLQNVYDGHTVVIQ